MTIREQVQDFHRVVLNVTDPTTPTVPDDATVRLRAALITEEFFETMFALFEDKHEALENVHAKLVAVINRLNVKVDMVELADGCADLDYVVEGTRLAFGIDGGPVAAEVQRSNMAKAGGPVRADGKRLKPPDWTAPDIAGVLRRQGWRP
jgi:predicted HAD superfamily Cof-like phosphohydrolase